MRLVKDDLFLEIPEEPGGLRLRGSECQDCGEVFFGSRIGCENCQSERLTTRPLSRTGELYSYTILRNRPPSAFGGELTEDGWMAVGLVELPEGVRVLSPIRTPDDSPPLGLRLELELIEVQTPDGPATAYSFGPVAAGTAQAGQS